MIPDERSFFDGERHACSHQPSLRYFHVAQNRFSRVHSRANAIVLEGVRLGEGAAVAAVAGAPARVINMRNEKTGSRTGPDEGLR